jgi:hypothetical protein
MLRVFFVLFVFVPTFAGALEAKIKGMGKMQSYFDQLIVPGSQKNAPFPKLYILDTQAQRFLTMQQLYTLLDEPEKTKPLDSIFTESEEKVAAKTHVTLRDSTTTHYIAFYFNAPDDFIEVVESMLPGFEQTHIALDQKLTAHPEITYFKNF